MVTPRRLDVYEAAYLAGGPRRVVDTAVVALVETGRVRARTAGDLHVVQDSPRHEVEAAVLAAVGSGGPHRIDIVRWVATRDRRLTALADRLKDEGLLSGNGLARLLSRDGRPLTPTAAGRRTLRELRADPPAGGPAEGSSAAAVALGGLDEMPDRQLRAAVFHRPDLPPHPANGGTRFRQQADYADGGSLSAGYLLLGGGGWAALSGAAWRQPGVGIGRGLS